MKSSVSENKKCSHENTVTEQFSYGGKNIYCHDCKRVIESYYPGRGWVKRN